MKISHQYTERGMTLIEILIVLAIIASIMAFLVPGVTRQLDKSKVQETKIQIGQIMNALNLYYTDCGKFPSSLDGLIKPDADCSNWGPEPYLKKAPKDAWNRPFQYSLDGNQYTIRSLGSDGREGGDGYAKDISSDDVQ
jgi:general secretion pathway protein G